MAKKEIKYGRNEYIKDDRALKAKIDEYTKKIGIRRTKLAAKFINDNSPVQVGKVYEPLIEVVRRKGCNRFVVSQQQTQFMVGSKTNVMILVGGYWIDKITDTAKVWDGSIVVYGVFNSATFKLAENQKYIDVDGVPR